MDIIDLVLAVYIALLLHSITISALTRGGERSIASGLEAFFLWSPSGSRGASRQYKEHMQMYNNQLEQMYIEQQQEQAYQQEQQEQQRQQEQQQQQWMQQEQQQQQWMQQQGAGHVAWGEYTVHQPSQETTQLPTLPTYPGIMQSPPPQALPHNPSQPMMAPIVQEMSDDEDDGYARVLHRGSTSSLLHQ